MQPWHGTTAAELLTSYWHSRHKQSSPPKVYFFNRRIHHGEIGALLGLSSLFLRGTSNPTATAAAILTGMALGLVKDDYLDIMNWFKFTKKGDQKQTRVPTAILEKEQATTTVKESQTIRQIELQIKETQKHLPR